LLKEATEILHPLAKDFLFIFGNKQAYFLYLYAQSIENDQGAYKQALNDALSVVQNDEWKNHLQELLDGLDT